MLQRVLDALPGAAEAGGGGLDRLQLLSGAMLEEAKRQRLALELQLAEAREEAGGREEQVHALQAQVAALQAEVRQSMDRGRHLIASNERLTQQLQSAEEEKRKLRLQVERLKRFQGLLLGSVEHMEREFGEEVSQLRHTHEETGGLFAEDESGLFGDSVMEERSREELLAAIDERVGSRSPSPYKRRHSGGFQHRFPPETPPVPQFVRREVPHTAPVRRRSGGWEEREARQLFRTARAALSPAQFSRFLELSKRIEPATQDVQEAEALLREARHAFAGHADVLSAFQAMVLKRYSDE